MVLGEFRDGAVQLGSFMMRLWRVAEGGSSEASLYMYALLLVHYQRISLDLVRPSSGPIPYRTYVQ